MTIPLRIVALTALTMLAFAGNSLLCRMALRDTGIDPAAFTALRLLSGAAMLWLLVRNAPRRRDSICGDARPGTAPSSRV